MRDAPSEERDRIKAERKRQEMEWRTTNRKMYMKYLNAVQMIMRNRIYRKIKFEHKDKIYQRVLMQEDIK